jgi:hypothetical protein
MHDILMSRELEPVEGFDLRVDLVPDFDAETEDSPYGVIVTASRHGIDLGSDSLWMTDAGGFDDDGEDFIHGYGPDLIAEAVAHAKSNIHLLTGKV